MLDEREQQRSQRGPVQRAPAAEQDGDEDQPGLAPAELGGVDEAVQRSVEVSRETGQRSRDDERDQLITARRISEGPHPLIVAADPFHNPPVRRPQQAREQQVDENHGRPDGDIRRCASLAATRFDVQAVGAAQRIQAHGEDGADHRFSQELQPEAIAAESHRAQGRRRGEQKEPPPHRPSKAGPSRPRGRQSSTAAITAYTMALAKPGRSTLPKVSARPTSSAPKKAPLIEPIPPITTTTNERMRTFSPIPGYTVVSGAASIPARPGSAVPALKPIA